MIARSTVEEVRDAVGARREPLVALCAQLVAARSVTPPGDTVEVAEVVSRALAALGHEARTERQHPDRPNVVAELDSGVPGPHLVLNCHLDTMPAGDEADWSVDPWRLTRADGRLYGLGMGNMKGSVAAMTHAFDLLAARRGRWRGRVTLLAVSDEVAFGADGAAFLLDRFPQVRGDALLCGEGAGYSRLAVGEKGLLWLRLRATGEAGHSSKARAGTTATGRLAAALAHVDALNGEAVPLPPGLAGLTVGEDDHAFRLTANIGTVRGGTFIGQRAVAAEAEIDLRVPPGLGIDELESRVRALCAGSEVAVERIKGWEANWTDLDHPVVAAWQRVATALSGAPSPLAIRQPASDASRWRGRGVPALCFGPQPFDSAGVDDFAEEDEVLRCAALFTLAALEFLSVEPPVPGSAAPAGT